MAKEFKIINNFFRVKDTISGKVHILEGKAEVKYHVHGDDFSFFPLTPVKAASIDRATTVLGIDAKIFNVADIVDENGLPFADADAVEGWLSSELGVSIININNEVYTVELMDSLSVSFYADSSKQISSVNEVLNSTTITITDDNVLYVYGETIEKGSKITVVTDSECVINLNMLSV